MRKKISFYKLIRLWGIVFLTALAVVIVGIDLLTTEHDFNLRIDNMRTDYVEQQKLASKREVERIVNMINNERTQSELLTKDKIKSRVYEAYSIAQNIYQQNKTAKSDAEIQKMIIDALRPIRFEHGSGYYFVDRLDGVVLLLADKPEMEGLNLLDLQDSRGQYIIKDTIEIAMQSGEGFYEYRWTKPQSKGSDFKKISFIKRFEPYDIFFGAGLYVDDVEEQIKAKWMERINNIRFGKNKVGYIFAGDWTGKSLAHGAQPDLVGKDLWEWEDSRGNKTSQMIIAASKKKDGGYANFWWQKPDTGKESPKIAYAKSVPEWEVFVASGVYTEEIEQKITTLQAALNAQTKTKVLIFIIIVAIAFAVFIVFFNLLSNRLRKDLNLFVSFLDQAAFSDEKVDRENVQFVELDQIAESTNKMLTDRKQAQEAVIASEYHLKKILSNIGDPVFVKDDQYRFTLANDAFCSILGLPREEIIGKTLAENLPQDEMEHFLKIDRQVLTDGQDNLCEESLTAKGEKTLTVITRKTRYVNENGDKFIIGVIRDITESMKADKERVKLESQLHQSHKMEAIGTMAGGIAHDFNNLLAIIGGNLALAQFKIPSGEPVDENLEQIRQASVRAKKLVSQILSFSRQEKQLLVPTNLSRLISEALKLLRPMIPSTVEVVTEAPEHPITINADKTQLHQVLINLCSNAIHAMNEKGLLQIRLEEGDAKALLPLKATKFQDGQYVKLSVIDDGRGMEKETLERIFDPFYTTKEVGAGTGMGLSVVHGIIEQHSGFIDVESAPGKGATFNLIFPVICEIEREETHVADHSLPTGSEHILVVDDEEYVADVCGAMLEHLGYKVTVSTNSFEALELFRGHSDDFNLVITDQTMPGLSGMELAKELLQVKPDLPIILCSGYSNKVNEEAAKEKGLCAFCMKPLEMTQLASVVREVLDAGEHPPETV